MADNGTGYSVGFTLRSSFDNTGTKQAEQALNGVASTAGKTNNTLAGAGAGAGKMSAGMKQGAASAAALAAALGQGNGGAGLAARSFGAILGGLASGPVGLVIAGVAAISAVLGYFKSKAKEAKEEFEKGVTAYQKLQGDRVAAQYKRITEAIDAQVKAQKELNAARMAGVATKASLEVAKIDSQTQDKMSAAGSDTEKEAIKLQGEIAKQQIVNHAAKQKAEDDYLNAENALTVAYQREAAASENASKAKQVWEKSGGEAKVENQAKWQEAEKIYTEALNATVVAQTNVQTAKDNQARVANETATAMQTALEAQERQTKAVEDAASLAEIEALEAESARAEHADNIAKQKAAEKAITDKKQAIAQAAEDEKQAADDRARRARIVDAAKNMSPNDWALAGGKAGIESGMTPDQQKARDKAEADARKRDARNADKVARGVKLSDSEKEWWRNYKELKWARDMGAMDNAAEKQAKEQAEVMAKQLTQLEKIATNLTKTLTESGGN